MCAPKINDLAIRYLVRIREKTRKKIKKKIKCNHLLKKANVYYLCIFFIIKAIAKYSVKKQNKQNQLLLKLLKT